MQNHFFSLLSVYVEENNLLQRTKNTSKFITATVIVAVWTEVKNVEMMEKMEKENSKRTMLEQIFGIGIIFGHREHGRMVSLGERCRSAWADGMVMAPWHHFVTASFSAQHPHSAHRPQH